jgi:D-sedoheptulose 7-phosphate isomerase
LMAGDTQPGHAGTWITNHLRAIEKLRIDDADAFVAALIDARERDAAVFTVGNGGSATTASHMTIDLLKTATAPGRQALRAQCLNDVAALTAIANDMSFEETFVVQLRALARPGDVVVAISGSGRSPNVLRALEWARSNGLLALGLLGMGGGEARQLCDVSVVIDSDDYGVIEDLHLMICHLATARLRDA